MPGSQLGTGAQLPAVQVPGPPVDAVQTIDLFAGMATQVPSVGSHIPVLQSSVLPEQSMSVYTHCLVATLHVGI